MSGDETRAWKQDVDEATDALLRCVEEKFGTLNPVTKRGEDVERLSQVVARVKAVRDTPDVRPDSLAVVESMRDIIEFAALTRDLGLLQRLVWVVNAYRQWQERVYEREASQ
jgi:hypothetical protein